MRGKRSGQSPHTVLGARHSKPKNELPPPLSKPSRAAGFCKVGFQSQQYVHAENLRVPCPITNARRLMAGDPEPPTLTSAYKTQTTETSLSRRI